MVRHELPVWVRRTVLVVVVVLLVMSLAVGLASARMPSAASRATALNDARRLWHAQGVAHYRLVMQAPAWCRIDVEIQNERVLHVYKNSCPGPAQAVTDLFALVERMNANPNQQYCGPNGCECVEQRFAQAEYDARSGFPTKIKMRRQRATNWDGLWQYMLAHGLPNCLTPPDTEIITVLSFQPLG
ncbi:MAG TPA: DUF6174 domain-containing protein [Kouleothrix sp.]|nr:DUF6174 domain-containing protein [Kouleothrix sp.]